jgi:hypothetical protein
MTCAYINDAGWLARLMHHPGEFSSGAIQQQMCTFAFCPADHPSRSCPVHTTAGKLAEDEKQKVKVQRLLIAMGAQPEEFVEEAAAQEVGKDAVAANGLPEEPAPLPAADGDADMDTNMDVDMDAGMVTAIGARECTPTSKADHMAQAADGAEGSGPRCDFADDATAAQPPEAAGQPAAAEDDAGRQPEAERSDRHSKRLADDRKQHGDAEDKRGRDREKDRDRDRGSRREPDRYVCSSSCWRRCQARTAGRALGLGIVMPLRLHFPTHSFLCC